MVIDLAMEAEIVRDMVVVVEIEMDSRTVDLANGVVLMDETDPRLHEMIALEIGQYFSVPHCEIRIQSSDCRGGDDRGRDRDMRDRGDRNGDRNGGRDRRDNLNDRDRDRGRRY